MSPIVDFLVHVVIVAAEVAALVVVYRLAKQQSVADVPQMESAELPPRPRSTAPHAT